MIWSCRWHRSVIVGIGRDLGLAAVASSFAFLHPAIYCFLPFIFFMLTGSYICSLRALHRAPRCHCTAAAPLFSCACSLTSRLLHINRWPKRPLFFILTPLSSSQPDETRNVNMFMTDCEDRCCIHVPHPNVLSCSRQLDNEPRTSR